VAVDHALYADRLSCMSVVHSNIWFTCSVQADYRMYTLSVKTAMHNSVLQKVVYCGCSMHSVAWRIPYDYTAYTLTRKKA
jgi:hypothetical protein